MIIYPDIDPVIVHLWGPLALRWYGLMYLVGFVAALTLGKKRARASQGLWQVSHIEDLIFYGACGVILGGRIGYVLFYQLDYFLHNPAYIFAIYDGGMSFHGGLLGVLVAMFLYGHKHQRRFLQVTDFIAPLVPIGLGAGRLGNFINHELPGRITHMPWGFVFPNDSVARHPSSLYEFALEGVVLFSVLWCFSKKVRPIGQVSGLFLLAYGAMRFFVEFFRQPDPQLGFIAFDWLTMGQALSLPMMLLGAILLWRARHTQPGGV